MGKLLLYIVGYLKRPYLWKDLLRQPLRLVMLGSTKEKSKKEATRWAEKHSAPLEIALEKIANVSQMQKFSDLHANLLSERKEIVDSFPIRIGGGADVDMLYALVRAMRPTVVLETGVASGWSSLAILKALEENAVGILISIDRPDMKLPNDKMVGCAVPDYLKTNWILLRGTDRDRLPSALNRARLKGGLTLCHYDSDKSYYGRAWAYRNIWEFLDQGGCLVSDDISDNTAFKDFCEANSIPSVTVKISDERHVGFAVKETNISLVIDSRNVA